MQTTPASRLVEQLTANDWTKRHRNSVARLLADAQTDDELTLVTRTLNGRYRRNRALLLKAVSEAFGCAAHISTESYIYQGKRLRYTVIMFGHRSDLDRAEALNDALLAVALGQVQHITGDNVLSRRRAHFLGFIDTITHRMRDVTSLPSCTWVPQHRDEAQRFLVEHLEQVGAR